MTRDTPVYLDVKVVPKASRAALAGWLGEVLKVTVTAAPEKGRANAAVEALLAEQLCLPAAQVSVVAGHGHPRKRLAIRGLSADALQSRLQALLGPQKKA